MMTTSASGTTESTPLVTNAMVFNGIVRTFIALPPKRDGSRPREDRFAAIAKRCKSDFSLKLCSLAEEFYESIFPDVDRINSLRRKSLNPVFNQRSKRIERPLGSGRIKSVISDPEEFKYAFEQIEFLLDQLSKVEDLGVTRPHESFSIRVPQSSTQYKQSTMDRYEGGVLRNWWCFLQLFIRDAKYRRKESTTHEFEFVQIARSSFTIGFLESASPIASFKDELPGGLMGRLVTQALENLAHYRHGIDYSYKGLTITSAISELEAGLVQLMVGIYATPWRIRRGLLDLSLGITDLWEMPKPIGESDRLICYLPPLYRVRLVAVVKSNETWLKKESDLYEKADRIWIIQNESAEDFVKYDLGMAIDQGRVMYARPDNERDRSSESFAINKLFRIERELKQNEVAIVDAVALKRWQNRARSQHHKWKVKAALSSLATYSLTLAISRKDLLATNTIGHELSKTILEIYQSKKFALDVEAAELIGFEDCVLALRDTRRMER